MKLDEQLLRIVYHDAMIKQYAASLRKEGFAVEIEKNIIKNSLQFQADLYATKGSEKRIYEFKLVGKPLLEKQSILKFKEFAKQVDAIPFVIYVNPPIEKNIEIDGLNTAIYSYFECEGIPSGLDALSTHSGIDDIEIDDIVEIRISSDSMTASGNATIYVNLRYGSYSDDGLDSTANFPMSFTAELDFDLSITDLQYAIDTSGWYDDEP